MYRRGDVVLLPFPFTDLTAIKTRPVVVLSIDAFQQTNGDFTVAMITSVPHNTPFDYELLDWKDAHLLGASWVRAKLATLDPTMVRYSPGRLKQKDIAGVEKRISQALGLS